MSARPDTLAAELGTSTSSASAAPGMSGIARIMLARGVDGLRQRCQGLARAGCPARARAPACRSGTTPTHVGRLRTVVVSAAIRRATSRWSRRRPAASRSCTGREALAALMAGHRSVAVAGTHGKTTTTSMLTVALCSTAASDPSFAIGGHLSDSGANAHHGSGGRLRRGGRRERRVVPALPARGRGRHQRRPRPSGPLWRRRRPTAQAFVDFAGLHRAGRAPGGVRRRRGRCRPGCTRARRVAGAVRHLRRGRRRRPAHRRPRRSTGRALGSTPSCAGAGSGAVQLPVPVGTTSSTRRRRSSPASGSGIPSRRLRRGAGAPSSAPAGGSSSRARPRASG